MHQLVNALIAHVSLAVLGPCSPSEVSLHFPCALPRTSRWFRNRKGYWRQLKVTAGRKGITDIRKYFFWWLESPQKQWLFDFANMSLLVGAGWRHHLQQMAFSCPRQHPRKRKGCALCLREAQKQVLPKEWKKLTPVLSRENTLFPIPSSSGIKKLD